MAIVKMKRLRLMAMTADREELLNLIQHMGCVEVGEPSHPQDDPTWSALTRPVDDGLLTFREEQSAAERALAVLKQYAPQKGGLLQPKPGLQEAELFDQEVLKAARTAAEDINGTERRLAEIAAEESKLAAQRAVLAPWLALDLPLETESTAQVTIQLGTLPAMQSLEQALETLKGNGDLAQLSQISVDRETRYCLLVYHNSQAEVVRENLKELGWSRANLRDWTGTAEENDARIQRELETLAAEKAKAVKQLTEMGNCRNVLQRLSDWSSVAVRREESKLRLLDTDQTFLLEGWIPAERWEALKRELEPFACAFEAVDPAPEEYPEVPVKLKNNFITRSLSTVTEMYSLPAYGSVDPNPLMAPFFILFYGMMMADMGYGLLMMLGCGVVLKKKKPKNSHFFELFFWCGIATFLWGAITGGFFGDAPYQVVKMLNPNSTWQGLPALFNPLDDALMVLIGSLVLGLCQIFTGMAVSMIRKIRQGNLMQALCEEGAWYAVFALFGVATLTGAWSTCLIAILVLLIVTQSYGKKGLVGKLMGIGGSLYNNITGYFSDILSYSRLMALMLAGAVIAQVFNTLGAITGNIVTFLIISVVGNALNLGLNLLGCYVHDLRLQCLEYFGRFYEDGGKAFSPLDLSTKYVDIKQD